MPSRTNYTARLELVVAKNENTSVGTVMKMAVSREKYVTINLSTLVDKKRPTIFVFCGTSFRENV